MRARSCRSSYRRHCWIRLACSAWRKNFQKSRVKYLGYRVLPQFMLENYWVCDKNWIETTTNYTYLKIFSSAEPNIMESILRTTIHNNLQIELYKSWILFTFLDLARMNYITVHWMKHVLQYIFAYLFFVLNFHRLYISVSDINTRAFYYDKWYLITCFLINTLQIDRKWNDEIVNTEKFVFEERKICNNPRRSRAVKMYTELSGSCKR